MLLQMEPRGFSGMEPRGFSPGVQDELEGTLEVVVEDHDDRSTVVHVLETDTGRVRIRERAGDGSLKGLVTGTRIRVRGSRGADGSFEIAPKSGTREGGGGDESVTAVSLASPNTFGPQRTAVILVNFQDDQSAPYGWAHAANVTFGEASSFFAENSYGQTSLYGDVFGWFTIPLSASVCDTAQIASLADQAVANTGVNINGYSRRVYAFPRNACSFWGRGTVGGNPSRSWIKGTYSVKVVAHELGHNFGDWHSNSAPCETGGCSHVEYGDDRDMMGLSGIGHFHAYQKERLGWLNYGASPAIQTVSASGTYWISSLQLAGIGPKAIKVLKSTSQSGNVYYYLESRSQAGFDAGFGGGVILHTGNELMGNSAVQVDLDPVTAAFDPVLDPDQTFSDSAARFSVRTISADLNGAWVEITIGGADATPCVTNAPQLSLSPGGTVTSTAGSAVSYSLSIANRDEAGCPSVTFELDTAVPAGWTWSASELTRTLTPGASATLAFTVVSAADASGTNQITANITRSGSVGPGASATGWVSIAATEPTPTPTPTPSPTPTPTPSPTPVPTLAATLTVSVNAQKQVVMETVVTSGAGPAAGAQLSFVITSPTGGTARLSATADSNGRALVKHKLKPKDPRGLYTVTLTAQWNGATATMTGTVVY
jgi:hypothetical protein